MILRSLSARYNPKVTTIQEAKDLNTLSLESLISNLQSHEMELNGDEPIMKSKTLSLKSVIEKPGGKAVRPLKVWKSEEASDEEIFYRDYDNEDIALIIMRFQKLTKRNKIFSGKSNGFRGSSSKDKVDDQKNCFSCRKFGHFKDDYLDMENDRPKKGNIQKDNF